MNSSNFARTFLEINAGFRLTIDEWALLFQVLLGFVQFSGNF